MRPVILIADTSGVDNVPFLQKKFPNARFFQTGPRVMKHPHGYMVAEVLLNRFGQGPVDIIFYPYLEVQGQQPTGWLERATELGATYICNSWGATARGTGVVPAHLDIGDTLALFASGNSDRSTRGNPDLTWDVNEPQRSLAHIDGVMVVGSCNAHGLPSTFSSEGLVDVAYRGERHWVYDPLTRRMVHVNGTSFACPMAVADAAREGFTTQAELQAYWADNAKRAAGWPVGMLHPKTGVGFMTDTIPVADAIEPLAYHDYEKEPAY